MSYKNPQDKRDYNRRYYLDNIDREHKRLADSKRERRDRIRNMVNSMKIYPCTDCGGDFPPYVMDFDHVGTDKVFNIASAISSTRSVVSILGEIQKCELVCANCHRIRTHARLNDLSSNGKTPDSESVN